MTSHVCVHWSVCPQWLSGWSIRKAVLFSWGAAALSDVVCLKFGNLKHDQLLCDQTMKWTNCFWCLWNSHSQILPGLSTPKMSQLQQWANGAMWLQEKYASRCFKLQDAYLFIYTVIYIYILYIYVCIYSQSHISLESGCDVKDPKTDRPGMGASLGWLSPWQKRSSAWRFHQLSRWTCIFSLCHATSCNNHSGTKKSNQLHNHSPAIHPYTQGLPTHEAKDRRPIHRPTWIPARAQLDASKNCPLCHGFETSFLFI